MNFFCSCIDLHASNRPYTARNPHLSCASIQNQGPQKGSLNPKARNAETYHKSTRTFSLQALITNPNIKIIGTPYKTRLCGSSR